MSQSTVMVFKKDGSFLTTIKTVTEREWVKNVYGTCTFSLSLNDPKAVQRYLEFGNYIFIQHAKLPNWGGKILPPQDLNDNYTITMNAFSGERLLELRRSGWKEFISASSPGNMFMELINRAQRRESLLIKEGSVYRGGSPIERTFDAKNMYSHITDIVKARQNEWSMTPERDTITNRLVFYANYYQKRETVSALILKEGHNIRKKSTPLKINGPIVNDLIAIGEGSDGTRPVSPPKIDSTSISRYGLMEGSVDAVGTTVQANVDSWAANTVKKWKDPTKVFQVTALDVGETFANLRLGYVLPLQMQTTGFKDNLTLGSDCLVKIIGMRYRDDTNECELNLNYVQENERMRRA